MRGRGSTVTASSAAAAGASPSPRSAVTCRRPGSWRTTASPPCSCAAPTTAATSPPAPSVWEDERRPEETHVIERYTLPEMGRVWSEAHKYELWCQVEVLVLEAHASSGVVPADAVAPVRAALPPSPEAVAEIEAVTQHDVIAFLSAWADNTEPREAAAFVHFGMTSSDLLDTALALQLTEATDILLAKADKLVAVLRDHALAHRSTLHVGRTHGIHGEPDVWGHRVADFAFGVARSRDRLRQAREAVGVMAISGAV